MRRRSVSWVVSVIVAAALAAFFAPAASARDDAVTSFDGTRIVLSFFPAEGLQTGQKAPTILIGPGWSSGRDTDENGASSDLFGSTGVGPFRQAGYNVLTWDPRGFGESGGTVQVDSPQYEGRDVQALIDYVARQPEAQLDGTGDPRLGMSGASYGGGIQLVTAAIDSRVDAIAPDIAWHSLVTSLYKAQSPKAGWGSALFALGVQGGTIPGIPAGETGTLDPHITSAYTSGLAYGHFPEEDLQWFASRGPGALVDRIRIPTLLIQGTADTLFTLDEATTNYKILRANNVPTKMIWFCGGHGACLTDGGPALWVEQQTVRWFERYLKNDTSVATGPRFEWIADDGQVRNERELPATVASVSGGAGLRPAADQPGRRLVGRAGRGDAESARPAPADQKAPAGQPDRRCTEADPVLQRPGHQLVYRRLRADRRQEAQHRRGQHGHADPPRARRVAAHHHLHAGRDRRQRRGRLLVRAADHSRHVRVRPAARRRAGRRDERRAVPADRQLGAPAGARGSDMVARGDGRVERSRNGARLP